MKNLIDIIQEKLNSNSGIFLEKLNNNSGIFLEKLKLGKDTKIEDDYTSEFGKGILTTFKNCDIYKICRYGMKTLYQEFKDSQLKGIINKYFNDNDKVWLVTESKKIDSEMPAKLALSLEHTSDIYTITDYHYYQQGYHLKKLENDQIVLIIRYYRADHKLWQTKWLFKI